MSHLFTCPNCETQTQVDDEFSGHRGRCIQCTADIRVPHFLKPDRTTTATETPAGRQRRLTVLAASLLMATGLVIFGLIAVIQFGGDSISRLANNQVRSSSIRNLERIALAMNNYAVDHGTYPPPMVRDSNGLPLHSWRALLLPYLDEQPLADQYNYNLPWNDPANLELQWQIPSVYQHPSANSGGGWQSTSNYYLITGPGTLFPNKGPLKPSAVIDSAAQTILVVEAIPVVPSGTWLEPIDLDYAVLTGDLIFGGATEMGGLTIGGATFATVDGRGHFAADNLDPAVVRALVTPAGNEPLADDTLD